MDGDPVMNPGRAGKAADPTSSNYLSADDAQHYVHVPRLLLEMEELGWQIDLVSERGGSGTSEVLGRRGHILSRSRSRWRQTSSISSLPA